jgi:hypothetical protein
LDRQAHNFSGVACALDAVQKYPDSNLRQISNRLAHSRNWGMQQLGENEVVEADHRDLGRNREVSIA